jgi:hypothetical protein
VDAGHLDAFYGGLADGRRERAAGPRRRAFLQHMVDFGQRIFELACDALAEQERQVSEVRGRSAALLAAGAVVPSLLAHTVFQGRHPHGPAEVITTVVGLAGAAGVLLFVVLLLRPLDWDSASRQERPTARCGSSRSLSSRALILSSRRPLKNGGTRTHARIGDWCAGLRSPWGH